MENRKLTDIPRFAGFIGVYRRLSAVADDSWSLGAVQRAMQECNGQMKQFETEKAFWKKKLKNIRSSVLSVRARRKNAAITGKNRVRPCDGLSVHICSYLFTPSAQARWRIEMKHPHGFGGLKGETVRWGKRIRGRNLFLGGSSTPGAMQDVVK